MEKARVLYITHEMMPYMAEESLMAKTTRELPQGMQEKGWEIRNFMPRFGCINERRFQLHEVIRLSGMNIIVNDTDQPLVIKVASIPAGRIQVYFIDNEEFFRRKTMLRDEAGAFFGDNDERAIFYCKGVLETVKKLGWVPDVIHVHGWMSSLVPFYVKTMYKNDPTFSNAKIVMSIYEEDKMAETFSKDFAKKAGEGCSDADLSELDKKANYSNLIASGLKYSDALVKNGFTPDKEIQKIVKDNGLKVLDVDYDGEYVDSLNQFYTEILQAETILG